MIEAPFQAHPPVSLRPMDKIDVDYVMAYEDELFGVEAWTPESYRAELADERRHYVIAERSPGPQAQFVGWAGLMVIAETAQILTVGVVPSEQGRGIGQALLEELLAEARRRGATEALLEVRIDNAAARRLYERNRFVVLRVRRGYYDLGRVDALEMKREL